MQRVKSDTDNYIYMHFSCFSYANIHLLQQQHLSRPLNPEGRRERSSPRVGAIIWVVGASSGILASTRLCRGNIGCSAYVWHNNHCHSCRGGGGVTAKAGVIVMPSQSASVATLRSGCIRQVA